ncbi:hypothetical protein J6590_067668 [Homalodisca vitripennis]|nr:hypothetical protein J6590_067668 [Homalodisca vitripennis]
MAVDFHEECATAAFRQFDKEGTGFITALDFRDIMGSIKSHLLTKEVKDNLVAAAGGGQSGHKVSFPYFMAFNSLLNNMELVKRIYLNATNGQKDQELTKEEFLYSAQMMSQITPLEVDILFLLCHLIHQTTLNSSEDPHSWMWLVLFSFVFFLFALHYLLVSYDLFFKPFVVFHFLGNLLVHICRITF